MTSIDELELLRSCRLIEEVATMFKKYDLDQIFGYIIDPDASIFPVGPMLSKWSKIDISLMLHFIHHQATESCSAVTIIGAKEPELKIRVGHAFLPKCIDIGLCRREVTRIRRVFGF